MHAGDAEVDMLVRNGLDMIDISVKIRDIKFHAREYADTMYELRDHAEGTGRKAVQRVIHCRAVFGQAQSFQTPGRCGDTIFVKHRPCVA